MYETILDPRHIFDYDDDEIVKSEAITKDEKDYFFDKAYMNFNTKEYNKIVLKYAMDQLQDIINELNDTIKIKLCEGGSIFSPRFYNFSNDQLDFTVDIADHELEKILPTIIDDDKFWEWAEQYKSYDGFISFMPYYKEEFIEAISGKDITRALAMYLTYINDNSGYIHDKYYIYENITSNYGLTDFIDDKKALEIYDKAMQAA